MEYGPILLRKRKNYFCFEDTTVQVLTSKYKVTIKQLYTAI